LHSDSIRPHKSLSSKLKNKTNIGLFITKSKHQLYSVLSISIKIVAIVVCNFTECFYIDKYRKMVDGAQAVHTVYEMHVRKSGKGNSFSGNGAAHPTPD